MHAVSAIRWQLGCGYGKFRPAASMKVDAFPVPTGGRTDAHSLTGNLGFGRGFLGVSFQDKTLTCVSCGAPFVFTAGEQEFYAERQFAHEPKRCSACRQQRAGTRGGGGGGDRAWSGNGGAGAGRAPRSGGSYGGGSSYGDNGGSYGGGAGGGGSYGGGGGGGGARQMHIATCSSCGNEARLPFVPRGDRPVYCSDCFGRQRDGGSSW